MKKKPVKPRTRRPVPLYKRIRNILDSAHTTVARTVNTTQVVANWLIGREIFDEEQQGQNRGSYAERVIRQLASRLKVDFGSSYSVSNLKNMRQLFREYPDLLDSDYLDSDEACDCLAACEVLARLQGRWGVRNSYSEDLDAWIESNPLVVPAKLKQAADSAIERILGPDSELPELWDEGGRNEAWHHAIDDLRQRVMG